MNSKINQHRILSALKMGLLVSSLVASTVMAAECGQAKLVEAGSAGVNVLKNTCQQQSRITLGTVLELPSGSRMWLKFDPSTTGESFQLICQNKSAGIVTVNITSNTAPWIKAEGLQNCEQWKANKLSCDGSNGEKSSFFCASASAKPAPSDTREVRPELTTSVTSSKAKPEMTTSVKMRGITIPTIVPVDEVIKSIKPEIELCKSLYNVTEKVDMSWTVSLGIIKDLSVNNENKDFVACVEGVAKQANANQDISVKYSF
jgi:hypothetical protein